MTLPTETLFGSCCGPWSWRARSRPPWRRRLSESTRRSGFKEKTAMTEPWFNPNAYAWIPGTLLGVAGGIAGTLDGLCASRGKCKTLVLGLHYTIMLICCLLLAAGVVALMTGQPYGVWHGFGLRLARPVLLRPFHVAPSQAVHPSRTAQVDGRRPLTFTGRRQTAERGCPSCGTRRSER